MGSLGDDYRCPLCGRVDPHAYVIDIIGYPTCSFCNTATGSGNSGGLWHADTPVAIRKRQLIAIRGNMHTLPFYRFTMCERALCEVAKFLVPETDDTEDFKH